jgi:acetyltransferase EpsM
VNSGPRHIAVIGAGGHAKVVLGALFALRYEVAAVFDDDPSKAGGSLRGIPIVGPLDSIDASHFSAFVCAVGDNRARREAVARLAMLPWLSVVHPRAWVDPSAHLSPGVVVAAGAVVQADARIGSHAIVNTGASVDHDCSIGAYAHLAPGARLAGDVSIGEGTLLGIASACIPGVRVGAWSVVGAGAVVLHEVPDGVMVAGVPATRRRA